MAEDNIHQFFMEAHRISQEAQFIVDSLPNAEQAAVERLTHQLSAIRTILATLDDPAIDAAMLSDLVGYVDSLLQPLENFLSHPPPPARAHIPLNRTGGCGRPSYNLDLDRALLLHDLGNTWGDIAKAMGVSRATLYNQMEHQGPATARKHLPLPLGAPGSGSLHMPSLDVPPPPSIAEKRKNSRDKGKVKALERKFQSLRTNVINVHCMFCSHVRRFYKPADLLFMDKEDRGCLREGAGSLRTCKHHEAISAFGAQNEWY
ncbi:hypothetical protein B0H10DRAFT_2191994 [Mycena sp. CBHHK59/15]|nr:hypothetical protein B0H10DRAFT_2191994 [Mycena sp. CBHHK59/15]